MSTNFRLNNRKNSNQLSDKIIDSSQEVFDVILSDKLIQQILMKGGMTDVNIEIAHRRQKDAIEYINALGQLFANIKKLTQDQNEIQFFDMCNEGILEKLEVFSSQFEKTFGKIDRKLLDSPSTQPNYGLHINGLFNTEKGFLRGLMQVMASFMVCSRVMVYLKQNPNYLDNDLAKMFCYEDWNLMAIVDQLRQMVDRRGDHVSEEEVKSLSEVFRRGVVYERLVQNHECNRLEWYEF